MSERPTQAAAERKIHHASFAIERVYPASPERVFAAWSQPAAKQRWFAGTDGWQTSGYALDFRAGGQEQALSRPPSGEAHRYHAHYHDIVPNQRIVYAYDMYLDDIRISVSLVTVALAPAGEGTRLVFTEQAVFLDGYDRPDLRESGTRQLLDSLGRSLAPAGGAG
jgi:uncharacterized protein YndB with AHSA1/START domain